jgi:CelD/BcsL family acetyltransferase involved in cellulose biosynthesis
VTGQMQSRAIHLPTADRFTVSDTASKRMSKPLSIEVLEDWEAVVSLAVIWDELARQGESPSIFKTWEYASTWWEIFGGDCKTRALVARDEDGAVAGIAPFIITKGSAGPRRFLRQLTFIGCIHEPVSQFMDFLVRRDLREEVGALFARHVFRDMSHEWDVVSVPLIEPTSAVFRCFSEEAGRSKAGMWLRERVMAPYCALPKTWDALYATRSKRFRANLRLAQNRVAQEGRIEVLIAGENIPFDEAFEAFRTLHDERWGSRSRAFAASRSEQFMRDFASRLLGQQRLLLILIRIDGEWAAAGVEYIHDGVVFGIQSGWKSKFAKLSIGNITLIHEMQWSMARGLREFNFLAGEDGYKLNWMTGYRELLSVEYVNPASPRARIFAWLRRRKAMLRAFLGVIEKDEKPARSSRRVD